MTFFVDDQCHLGLLDLAKIEVKSTRMRILTGRNPSFLGCFGCFTWGHVRVPFPGRDVGDFLDMEGKRSGSTRKRKN